MIVHDVTPKFHAEIDHILQHLQPLVGRQIGGAVVPCWHGRGLNADDRQRLQQWGEMFGEVLLHGDTHYRHDRPGVVSWLTGRADEFSNMSSGESVLRLCRAQSLMREIFGSPLRGFVPPAWQFPGHVTDLQTTEIEYLLRFRRLETSQGAVVHVATWSWDWGWLPGTSRTGATLGAFLKMWQPTAIPMVVLHPADVARGCIPHALRMIQRLLQNGWIPVLPADIANGVAVGVSS